MQTWPNMSSRRADSCSDSTSNSNEELSDGPFEEGGHRKTWLEDEVQANQEELSEASNAGTRAPPSPQVEEDTTVFWKPKVGYNGISVSMLMSFYELDTPSNVALVFLLGGIECSWLISQV